MKVPIITETLTNFEIAERQLNRSITLFMDDQDYISALTLAGAAEEILGKLLLRKGEKHILEEEIDFNLKYQKIDLSDKEARKGIANLANYFKNRMKHLNETDSITFSVDFYSAEIIDRACSNYWKLTSRETPQMVSFKEEVLLGEYYNPPTELLNC